MGPEKAGKKLENARKKIDEIDAEIVQLLDKRAEAIEDVTEGKRSSGVSVYDPAREKEVLQKILSKNNGKFPKNGIKDVFEQIFQYSRALQEPMKIAFLGPETSFTHIAALKRFGSNSEMITKDSIKEVFNSVERGEANYGVVPIENSSEGSVTNTFDMFVYSDLKIVAEVLLNVHHHLISKYSLEDIRKIYSRPIALAQCKEWIMKNMPNAERIEVSSTAKGAESAALYLNSAAVASDLAAKQHKLNILQHNIEDNPNNITRFLVIGKSQPKSTGKDKTSIVYSVKHESGALFNSLMPLREHKINMTKIESRPTRIKAWDYVFFVDMQGFVNDKKINAVLEELKKNCAFVKVLGSYPEESLEVLE